MKKILCTLLLFVCAIIFTPEGYASEVQCYRSNVRPKKFKRIYTHTEVNRNANRVKREDDISITFEDFSNHFEIGRNRILSGVFSPINMDIGAINSGTKETWVLPDFSTSTEYVSYTLDQLDPEGTDIYDSFEYGSHVIYSEELEIYELFDLTDFDLYFVGYEQIENGVWEEYQYDQTKAPIPVELGLNFISTVQFLTDIEGYYTEYRDIYDVIGQGTLVTFDDGESDAIKMIYKEETREFEDNVEVSYSERYEIVFYSKKGHYVYADITDPWNSEGVVSLSNINYHKLEESTASVIDENLNVVTTFPNPIASGQTLTIASKVSLNSYDLALYNVNGQKICNLNFTESQNNQYQTIVPEKISSGLYFYKVHNTNGGFIANGKIQIK